MIVEVHDRIFQIVVPQKSGISTIVNWLAYPTWGQTGNKQEAREHLGDRLIHIGGPDELQWAKQNGIKPDVLVACVRDPLDRAYSVWRDRIVKKQRHDWDDPSFDAYIDRLDSLDPESDCGKHSRPQCEWLTEDWEQYDFCVATQDFDQRLKRYLDPLLKTDLPTIRANHSGWNRPATDQNRLNKITEFYNQDYRAWNHVWGWFDGQNH